MCCGKSLIAFYLTSLSGGGAEKVTLNLIKGFLSRGYRLDLVLARAEGPFLGEVPQGCRVVDLKAGRAAKSLPFLVRYLRRERPQALISGQNYTNVIALTGLKMARIPTTTIVVEHNTLSSAMANARFFRARLLPTLMRLTYPWADSVVAVSQGVADDLKENLGNLDDKIKLIYNPVIEPDLPIKAKAAVEHPWFYPGSVPVILSVGRLTRQKDYPTLLKAFALVRSRTECRLVILGEGEDRKDLEAQAAELGVEEDVLMPGFVDNPYRYMSRASVFVLSSRWEGLPTVLIEAMACGTPLVSTDCPSGPAEILQEGKYGRLVPVGDVELLAQAIGETMGQRGIHLDNDGCKRFEVDAAVSSYEKLFKEV